MQRTQVGHLLLLGFFYASTARLFIAVSVFISVSSVLGLPSRAADLYKQILSKEVAKSSADEVGLPSTTVVSQPAQAVNGLPEVKVSEAPEESSLGRLEISEISTSPKASYMVITSFVKKPLGAKKTGKTGGLGARKLTLRPSENLYEQKPEEASSPAITTTNSLEVQGSAAISRTDHFGPSADSSIYVRACNLMEKISVQLDQDMATLEKLRERLDRNVAFLHVQRSILEH